MQYPNAPTLNSNMNRVLNIRTVYNNIVLYNILINLMGRQL